MTPLDIVILAVIGINVLIMTLIHSDPLTGRSLLDDLRDSWNQRRDEDG